MAYIQDWGMRVQAQPQINTTRRSFLHLSQNENGRMLNIRITDVNIPSGSTAVLAGTKPDGTVYSQAGTLAGNTATFAEDVQMTAVAGTWDAKITITNGGNCICTARITITIDPDTVAGGAVPSDSQLDGIIAECRAIADSVRKEAYGSPLVADAVEDMTDQSRVYVYTGSESGMTAGHWYYYNGSAWADGGVYNAVAVDTDTTLSIAGKAADAKKVGDELTSVKEDLNLLNSYDLLKENHRRTPYTANGTTWRWNGEVCTVSGTATASTVYDLYKNENAFPSWLSAGQTVYIKYSAQVVRFAIFKYVNGTFNTTPILDTTSYDGLLTIPADATGITIRFRMVKNTTADESVSVIFANCESNEKLQSKSLAIENTKVEIGHGYIEGKIVNPNNVAINAENWANTGIVPLYDTYDYIKLLNVSAGQSCFALFLDSNQKVISADLADSKGVLAAERIIKPPVGAAYIRCNMLKANKDIFKIYGLKTNLVVRSAVPETANQTFHAMTGNKLHTIFRKTKAVGALFTITDDDTTSLANVQKFHTVCAAESIRGCYAVMTKNTEADSNIVDALREYEKDGFQSVLHCNNQRAIFKPAPDRDIDACREDIAIAIQRMQNYGFSDYRHWVSPYGVVDQEMKDLARDFGFDCLIGVAQPTYCRFIPQNAYGLYNIPRMELYPTDAESAPGNTLAEIKAQMLDCATNGGWFHLCTHMYQWGDDLTRVTEILQYSKTLGMKNVTISGGLSYWRDIYHLYDLF